MAQSKVEDPSPEAFRIEIVISVIVIVIIGILVLVFASVIAGFVITLLGAIFGLGSQVITSNSSK